MPPAACQKAADRNTAQPAHRAHPHYLFSGPSRSLQAGAVRHGALVQVLTGSSYGFNYPDAISSDGTHVWAANYGGDSVTELNATTGALVQVISASGDGFRHPDAVSSDGTHVWVANSDDSVTELNAATGAGQVISGSRYGFDEPDAIASNGTDVWVANLGDQSITGFPA